jgi:CheY-like chemotaxis protein
LGEGTSKINSTTGMATSAMPEVLWGRTILVVEDETVTRSMIVVMLRKLSALRILEAQNGCEAQNVLARSGSVDCIICDLNMPEMNGLALLKKIRLGEVSVERSVPFAVLTGYGDAAYVAAAMELEADAFMIKPVKIQVLAERLRRILTEPRTLQDVGYYRFISIPEKFLIGEEQREMHSLPSFDEIENRKGMRYPLEKIPPNATLARSVVLENGVVLLRAGQILSPRLLIRLRDLADMDSAVGHLWIR